MKTNPKSSLVIWVLFLTVFSCFNPLHLQSAELSAQKAPVSGGHIHSLICNADKPMVFPGESTRLKVWQSSAFGKSFQYQWTVEVGQVKNEQNEALWDLSDVSPGIYKAQLQISKAKEVSAACFIQVIVRRRPTTLRGKSLETGRSFLLSKQLEEEGYGLYSYLLLGAPPGKKSFGRFLSAIVEYLKFPDINELASNFYQLGDLSRNEVRRKLNATFLPIDASPPQRVLDELQAKQFDSVALWVLQHYDYARARIILSGLSGKHREGPYIVSFLKPFRVDSPAPHLYQDQSWVPEDLVSLWMKAFLNQAAQEDFREKGAGEAFTLKLRTMIGVLATGFPEIQKSVSDLISWTKKL